MDHKGGHYGSWWKLEAKLQITIMKSIYIFLIVYSTLKADLN